MPVLYNDARSADKFLNLCCDLAVKIPCYELHFKPDNSFWKVIEELELTDHTDKF